MTSALDTLSRRLLPWLAPALAQLEAARRAGSLGHAWLISGPAGIGKINFALVLAHRLLGDATASRPSSTPAARSRRWRARHAPTDRHPDLHWLYPEEDKETISVEQVRDVIETFTLTAHRGGAKVVDHRAGGGDDDGRRQRAAEDARGADARAAICCS